MKPDLFCRNKTLYAGKTVQGNHTNSAEIETLCRKTISAENKTEKSDLFCRNRNIIIPIEVVHIP